MKAGAYFYKHDYGRAKRGRKWVVLSNDGLSLKWRAVGNTEVVQSGDGSAASSRGGTSSRGSFGGGNSARGLMKSASFSRFSSGACQTPPSLDQTARFQACAAARPLLRLASLHLTLPRAHSCTGLPTVPLSDVSHIIYGPYTDTFSKKSAHDRVDHRWVCFSLVLRESRTLDLAMEEESGLLSWLLGLQQLIVYFSPDKTTVSERWTLPKLQLQKLRLKVSGESDRATARQHGWASRPLASAPTSGSDLYLWLRPLPLAPTSGPPGGSLRLKLPLRTAEESRLSSGAPPWPRGQAATHSSGAESWRVSTGQVQGRVPLTWCFRRCSTRRKRSRARPPRQNCRRAPPGLASAPAGRPRDLLLQVAEGRGGRAERA